MFAPVRSLIQFFTRAPGWSKLAAAHLRANPDCIACGSRKNVVPHHKEPVHLFPERELDPTNLVTLCEGPVVNCHILFGHLRNWSSYNVDVEQDATYFRSKITNRPAI